MKYKTFVFGNKLPAIYEECIEHNFKVIGRDYSVVVLPVRVTGKAAAIEKDNTAFREMANGGQFVCVDADAKIVEPLGLCVGDNAFNKYRDTADTTIFTCTSAFAKNIMELRANRGYGDVYAWPCKVLRHMSRKRYLVIDDKKYVHYHFSHKGASC